LEPTQSRSVSPANKDRSQPQKFECGPGPATPDRIVRVFLTCLSPRRRRHDRFSQTAPTEASAALCRSRLPIRHRVMPNLQPCGWPAACLLLQRATRGRKAATPGQPVAQSAFLEVPPGHSLSRIAGDRWLCRNHSAQPGNLTFRCTHSPSLCCVPQVKNFAPLCRNCGRRDFPVEAVGNLRQNFKRQG
jgi:hypothetical protein